MKHIINHIDNDRERLELSDLKVLNETTGNETININESANMTWLRKWFRTMKNNSNKKDKNLNQVQRKADLYNAYLIASMIRMFIFGMIYYSVIKDDLEEPPDGIRAELKELKDFFSVYSTSGWSGKILIPYTADRIFNTNIINTKLC